MPGIFGDTEKSSHSQQLAAVLVGHEQQEYYKNLGIFVDQFAAIEAEMQAALRYFAKVSPAIAKSIFSGVKTDVGQSFIKRILEVKPLKSARKSAMLLDALAQLKAINDVRNMILHYGAMRQGTVWLVTNASVAHSKRSLKELPVTIQSLQAMYADLIKIGIVLATFHTFKGTPPKIVRPVINRIQSAAWRYKRPSQEKQDQEQTAARKKHPRSKPRQRRTFPK